MHGTQQNCAYTLFLAGGVRGGVEFLGFFTKTGNNSYLSILRYLCRHREKAKILHLLESIPKNRILPAKFIYPGKLPRQLQLL
jgi:hypothetical protein